MFCTPLRQVVYLANRAANADNLAHSKARNNGAGQQFVADLDAFSTFDALRGFRGRATAQNSRHERATHIALLLCSCPQLQWRNSLPGTAADACMLTANA